MTLFTGVKPPVGNLNNYNSHGVGVICCLTSECPKDNNNNNNNNLISYVTIWGKETNQYDEKMIRPPSNSIKRSIPTYDDLNYQQYIYITTNQYDEKMINPPSKSIKRSITISDDLKSQRYIYHHQNVLLKTTIIMT